MDAQLPKEGNPVPRPPAASDAPGAGYGARILAIADRVGSFRFVYLAVALFLAVYLVAVKTLEGVLDGHFREQVAEALRIDATAGPLEAQVQERIDAMLRTSGWVRPGGVQVSVLVFAADGSTPLYVGGRRVTLPGAPNLDPLASATLAARLLPATAELTVSVPHNALAANAILVADAALLLVVLAVLQRALERREEERLGAAIVARDLTAVRATQIERELDAVRGRLADLEPTEELQQEEIRALQRERTALHEKLDALETRERALRAQASNSVELETERRALEEMLDEAMRDVTTRDDEIRELEQKLRRAAKDTASTGGRARESGLLGRRLRALYKNLEIDDRAIDDLVSLRDADMQLKAEEAMKRLSDEPDTAAVRRKVGGLPPHLSIFELGFAGKGRIYYTRGEVRRHRVLTVGAKNSQKQDLEYLSRLA